jgi:hypothetical protein
MKLIWRSCRSVALYTGTVTLACFLSRRWTLLRLQTLLLNGSLQNHVFVLLSFLPVLLGRDTELDKSKHTNQIVPESHEKGSKRVKLARATTLVLDFLDLEDEFVSWRQRARDIGGAGSDPLSIHHAFASSAFALAAAIRDKLSSLSRNIAEWLTHNRHGGLGNVTLLEYNGNGPHETNLLEILGTTCLLRECFDLLPLGFVALFLGRHGRGKEAAGGRRRWSQRRRPCTRSNLESKRQGRAPKGNNGDNLGAVHHLEDEKEEKDTKRYVVSIARPKNNERRVAKWELC